MRGLYIHIPFCIKKCSYCDFYSLPGRLDSLESYVDAIVRESHSYAGLSFQTLFLGGGTPSLLGTVNFLNLMDGIRKSLNLSELVEATIEVNPESATREFFEIVEKAGINRVSFGVQSLSDVELKSVGRIHSSVQAINAIKLAKKCGLKFISADLIVGLPGQTWITLRHSLGTLVGLGIEHLSVYCLSLEEGTPLAECPPHGLMSDDVQAELFQRACVFLGNCGFIHYEISNFALEGCECQHNFNYWRGGEYVGLGASAASHLHGKRFRNYADLDAYLDNPAGQTEYVEDLAMKDKIGEESMLRLRLLEEGIAPGELANRFGHDNVSPLLSSLDCMVHEGLLTFEHLRYRLVPSRVLTSNQIFARVLSMGNGASDST